MVEKGRNCSQEQFLLFSTIFFNLILDFCIKTRTRVSLRDKRLFEITEVEITRVDCIISSPEHEVLMVSYCDQSMSVVRRPSCVVNNLF